MISLPDFSFKRPKTLKEAIDLLDQHRGKCVILAGGTDLISDMRARVKVPEVVIDIKNIEELVKVTYTPGKGLHIGAAAPINDVLKEPAVEKRYRCLYDSLSDLCDAIIRYRATIGGNICTASPAGDSAPSLLVLGASVEIQGPGGTRIIDLQDFFLGVKKNSLAQNEIVKAILVPDFPEGSLSRYYKMKRGAEDLAVVGTAGIHHQDGKVLLAYSSVAPKPVLVDVTDKINQGKTLDEKADLAVNMALETVKPISDVRGSAGYRKHLVDITTRFVLMEILGGKE